MRYKHTIATFHPHMRYTDCMFAKVYGAQTSLLKAHIVPVEIDIAKGLHSFSIVGLTDKAIDEARDRVNAALKNALFLKSEKFKSPKAGNKKIVVSLAPAHVKKEGPLFDVPIALAYLLAVGELSFDTSDKVFVGELALDGSVRSVRGVVPITQKARDAGFREIFVPFENAEEAALVGGITVYGVRTLAELITHLRASNPECEETTTLSPTPHQKITRTADAAGGITLDDIVGQEHAKRALIIAAAGGHNVALYGPPGTGKTMLAQALRALLPELAEEEALEVTGIHSVAGVLEGGVRTDAPFRAPHHTASYVSLVGGGTQPKPGEVTLAHRGVLFLDEFPEFDKRVINALRQPLEDGVVSISRAQGTALFPSSFILVAALNPCPCGYFGTNKCTCGAHEVRRYQHKISGPVMDRIDMWIEVGAIDHERLGEKATQQRTQTHSAREAVVGARARQKERFQKAARLNSGMSARGIVHHAQLTEAAKETLNTAAKKLDLSPRAYHRVMKLSRTIADLDASAETTENHVLEALSYRPKDNAL